MSKTGQKKKYQRWRYGGTVVKSKKIDDKRLESIRLTLASMHEDKERVIYILDSLENGTMNESDALQVVEGSNDYEA